MSIIPARSDTGGFGPTEPLLDHLVYAVSDLDAATREFGAATGVEPAEGVLLQWRLASVHPAPLDVVTPFLLCWGNHPAPGARTAPAGAARPAGHPS